MRPAQADLAFPYAREPRLPVPERDKPYRAQVSASAGKHISMETIRKYPLRLFALRIRAFSAFLGGRCLFLQSEYVSYMERRARQ
ncbi:hypothetical protein PGRAT_02740 [Paenibacillus graminis]|jgi:hypothetical protein|uniref:Uncharacterized protein n=1 Tax=Paenibacillus graminis TaxID=189425 RepID=A0A089LYS3_9BACL|nr:hypothetical protein PGRAT_02740 [Paenibacillus graminis]